MGETRVRKDLGRRKVKLMKFTIKDSMWLLTRILRHAMHVAAGRFDVMPMSPNAPPASYTAPHARGLQGFM